MYVLRVYGIVSRRGGEEEERRRRGGGAEEERRRRGGGEEEERRRRGGGEEEERRIMQIGVMLLAQKAEWKCDRAVRLPRLNSRESTRGDVKRGTAQNTSFESQGLLCLRAVSRPLGLESIKSVDLD